MSLRVLQNFDRENGNDPHDPEHKLTLAQIMPMMNVRKYIIKFIVKERQQQEYKALRDVAKRSKPKADAGAGADADGEGDGNGSNTSSSTKSNSNTNESTSTGDGSSDPRPKRKRKGTLRGKRRVSLQDLLAAGEEANADGTKLSEAERSERARQIIKERSDRRRQRKERQKMEREQSVVQEPGRFRQLNPSNYVG